MIMYRHVLQLVTSFLKIKNMYHLLCSTACPKIVVGGQKFLKKYERPLWGHPCAINWDFSSIGSLVRYPYTE